MPAVSPASIRSSSPTQTEQTPSRRDRFIRAINRFANVAAIPATIVGVATAAAGGFFLATGNPVLGGALVGTGVALTIVGVKVLINNHRERQWQQAGDRIQSTIRRRSSDPEMPSTSGSNNRRQRGYENRGFEMNELSSRHPSLQHRQPRAASSRQNARMTPESRRSQRRPQVMPNEPNTRATGRYNPYPIQGSSAGLEHGINFESRNRQQRITGQRVRFAEN